MSQRQDDPKLAELFERMERLYYLDKNALKSVHELAQQNKLPVDNLTRVSCTSARVERRTQSIVGRPSTSSRQTSPSVSRRTSTTVKREARTTRATKVEHQTSTTTSSSKATTPRATSPVQSASTTTSTATAKSLTTSGETRTKMVRKRRRKSVSFVKKIF